MPSVRDRASVLCIQDNRFLALRHGYADTDSFWGVPGGKIEHGEEPVSAALRETFEETGYRAELLLDPGVIVEYDFLWNNRIVPCRTRWFAVRPLPGMDHFPRAGDEEFITELRWFPLEQWRVLFADYPVLQDAIGSVLGQLKRGGFIQLAAGHLR